MTKQGLREHEIMSTVMFSTNIDKEEIGKVFNYDMFLDECAIACKLFYFGNGGEGIPNVIFEDKDGSGKFIVSSIL